MRTSSYFVFTIALLGAACGTVDPQGDKPGAQGPSMSQADARKALAALQGAPLLRDSDGTPRPGQEPPCADGGHAVTTLSQLGMTFSMKDCQVAKISMNGSAKSSVDDPSDGTVEPSTVVFSGQITFSGEVSGVCVLDWKADLKGLQDHEADKKAEAHRLTGTFCGYDIAALREGL